MKLIVDQKKNTRANCYELKMALPIGLLNEQCDLEKIKKALLKCIST